MTARKPSPATKQDLRSLEQRMTRLFRSEIDQTISESEARILRHFDLTVETIRHDLLGASADRLALLTDRVTRLEKVVGLAR